MPKINKPLGNDENRSLFSHEDEEAAAVFKRQVEELKRRKEESAKLKRIRKDLGYPMHSALAAEQLDRGPLNRLARSYRDDPMSAVSRVGYSTLPQKVDDPALTGLAKNIKGFVAQQSGGDTSYQARMARRTDAFGGHIVVQIVKEQGGRQSVVGQPFRLGSIDRNITVGQVGSGAHYVAKNQPTDTKPFDLENALQQAIRQQISGQSSVSKALGLTDSTRWNSLDPSLVHRSEAGRTKEIRSARAFNDRGVTIPPDVRESLSGVTAKGSVISFDALRKIPGYIESGEGFHLGEGGDPKNVMKAAAKRPKLHFREYSPFGPGGGQALPEVRQNMLWGGQETGDTAVPLPGLFFAHHTLAEGQGFMDPKVARQIFERFEDKPEKFRVQLPPGLPERHIAQNLGLVDPGLARQESSLGRQHAFGGSQKFYKEAMQRKLERQILEKARSTQVNMGPGSKLKAYPGHLGENIIANFQRATMTGYEIADSMTSEGSTERYMQLKGYRHTSVGGSASLKFAGNKAMVGHMRGLMSGAVTGVPVAGMFNAPSSSRQFMANVLNYMHPDELRKYWKEVHGSEPLSRVQTPDDFAAAEKVYLKYLDDHKVTVPMIQTMTTSRMMDLMDLTGRVAGYRQRKVNGKPQTTTSGEHLWNVKVKQDAYVLPFGAKLVRESSDQRNVGFSFEEGEIFQQMGMGHLWDKMMSEGKRMRKPFTALTEATALNEKGDIRPENRIVDLDELLKDRDMIESIFASKRQHFANLTKDIAPEDMTQKWRNKFTKTAGVQALHDTFGEDVIYKFNNKHVASPSLMQRFGFIDKSTNKEVNALQNDVETAIWEAVAGSGMHYHGVRGQTSKQRMIKARGMFRDLATRQANLLESDSARKEWLGAKTNRGIESVYMSLDEVGTNEVALSYKAISDMFNLKSVDLDWRTEAGRTKIDELASTGQLRSTGVRSPIADPTRQYGITLNAITPGILKSRGSKVDISNASRTPYFNPLWAMSQGGDNDADRARLAASSMVMKNKKGDIQVANLFDSSTPEFIRALAEDHPAGEYHDYMKKLGKGPLEEKFRDFQGYYTKQHIEEASKSESQLLKEQTGAVYNMFRRILPHFSDPSGVGRASAKYFQPLIDQNAYQPGTPMADLVRLASSMDYLKLSAGTTSDGKRKMQPGATKHVLSQQGSIVKEILGKLGEGQADWGEAMQVVFRGLAHSNTIKNAMSFQKKAYGDSFEKSNSRALIGEYHQAIDQNLNLLSSEDKEKYKSVSQSHGDNSRLLFRAELQRLETEGALSEKQKGTLVDMRKRRGDLTDDEITSAKQVNMTNQRVVSDLLGKIIASSDLMEKTSDEFEVLQGIMGAVAKPGSLFRQSGKKISRGRRYQGLGLVPKPAYTDAELQMMEQWEKPYERPEKKKEADMLFAEGGVVSSATVIGKTKGGQDMVAGEAGKEYIVPEHKVKPSGKGKLEFDPDALGRGGRFFAEGGIVDPNEELYHRAERAGIQAEDPSYESQSSKELRQSFDNLAASIQRARVEGVGAGMSTGGHRRQPEVIDQDTGEVLPAGQRSSMQSNLGGTVYKEIELKSYTKPFTSKLAEQYELLADNLHQYSEQVRTLYAQGGTLKDTQGKFTDTLKAATATYHSVVEQNQRAKTTSYRYHLQQREEAESITGREAAQLRKLREGRPQDITEVEAQLAGRVFNATEQILSPMREPGTRRLDSKRMQGNLYEMAARVGARGITEARENTTRQRQEFALLKSDRGIQDIANRQFALQYGRASGEASGDIMATATDISSMASERKGLYDQYVQKRTQYDEALGQGRMGQAKQLHQELEPLVGRMAELRDGIRMLTPEVKDHVDTLKSQTSTIKEGISQDEKLYTAMKSRYDTLEKQKEGKSGPERMAIADQQGQLSKQLDFYNQRIQQNLTTLGQKQAQVDQLQDAVTTAAGASPRAMGKRPQTMGDRLGGFLQNQFNPQRLFYESQALAQGYYMLGMPLARARDSFLGSEMNRGRMEYSLGLGSVGPEIAQFQRQRATMTDFGVGIGKGVNEVVSPWIDMIGSKMAGNEEFAPTLGKLGTYGFGLGVGGFAANKFGAFGLAGRGLSSLGGGSMLLGAGKLLAPALAVGAGIGGYEMMRDSGLIDKNKYASTSDIASTSSSILGLELEHQARGESAIAKGLGLGDWGQTAFTTGATIATGGVFNPTALKWLGYGQATDKELAERYTKGPELTPEQKRLQEFEDVSSARDSARQGLLPADIANIRKTFKEELGGRITEDQAGEIIRQYAESTGLKAGDIMKGSGRQNLVNISQMALDAGLEPEQLINYIGQAPKSAGVGIGHKSTGGILQMITGGGSIPEIESLMSSLQAVSGGAQATGIFENISNITKTFDNIMKTQGQYAAGRYESQMTLGNTYDYSAAAYAAGTPQLALMDQDQPWKPKYQDEINAIEDRRRGEDRTRGFDYQQQDIQFAEQKIELENQFWDLRMEQRQIDFGLQNRQHDLSVKQMEYNMNRQDQYAKLQEKNFKRNYEISLKLFDLQTDWQQEDMNKQGERMGIQRSWQTEGFAADRNQFELQSGWQQEDLQRAYRYSTGRDRLDIRRQMERTSIMSNLQRADLARREGQAATQYDWQQEDLATQQERFDISRPLQREQMTGGYEYQMQMMTLQEEDRAKQREFGTEQIAIMEARHAAWLEHYNTETPLLQERHQLEMEMSTISLERQKESLEIAILRSKEDEQMLVWQRQMTEAQQLYNATQQLGLETTRQWNSELAKLHEYMLDLSSGKSGGWQPNPSQGMALPGSTTPGGEYAHIGSQEEYVIPQHGALSLGSMYESSQKEVVGLLKTIAGALNTGAKIVLDTEALKASGFLHVEDLDQTYK